MKASPEDIATTENLKKALESYVPPKLPERTIRMLYNPENGVVLGTTFEETDSPHIVITEEEYSKSICQPRMRIVDGKITVYSREEAPALFLKEGEQWQTTEDNMLIMGKDKGWNDTNS